MNYWLMKSEPEAYSIDDLKAAPKQTECWDGIRNYQARNFMRDDMQIGDQSFFYHSNCKVPGIVGIAKIVSDPYPDHTQFDPESKYYDPKSTIDNPRWLMRDIKYVKKFSGIISINDMRDNPRLDTMLMLRKGNRLSITPISKKEWNEILKMTQT